VFSLPSSPRVRRIVAAYTINRLGTWFGYVALSIAVFDHTHSALAVAALLVAGQVLSAFLVPVLVARIEVQGGRGGLSLLYSVEALATGALAAVINFHFSLALVLVLVAIDGTAALAASALLRTAAAAGSREWAHATYAPGEHEAAGIDQQAAALEAERVTNATINVGFAMTFALGPALAGLVVPTFGVASALLIDAASFLACAAMLHDVVAEVQEGEDASVSARVRGAWSHVRQAPALRRLLRGEAVALIFFTFSGPLEVAYAKSSLHVGDSGYGLLVGVWGLGVALGSVVFARSIKRSLTMLLCVSTVVVGLANLGWAAAPSLAVASGASLIGGIGNGIQWASLISSVQLLAPQRLHGQLMGAVEGIGAISPAIGYSLGGAIAVISSPRDAFAVAGAGALLSTITFLRIPSGSLTRRAEPQESAPAETANPLSTTVTAVDQRS
jgi:MFS family permease